MKLVYFCDSHLALNGTLSRIDNYADAILEKIEEVLQFAVDKRVDALICGGDLFNSPTPSLLVVKRLVELLKRYNQKLYLCVGNHDIFGHQTLTLDRTIVGLLEESGSIFIENGIVVENNVSIEFQHFEHDFEDKLRIEEQFNSDAADIIVSHAMITDGPFFGNYIKYSDINQKCKIMLCSHYHPGFGIQRANNTFFVAPGALARTSVDAHNLVRQPSFVYLDMTKTKLNELKIIPLQCAKNAQDCFNTDNMVKTVGKVDIDKRKYLDMMSALELGGINLEDVVKEVGKKEGINQLIVLNALKYIE